MTLPDGTAESRCDYHYDALDRLASRLPGGQPGILRFYQASRPVTDIQGPSLRCWLQIPERLLAQQDRTDAGSEWALVAFDIQGSVLYGMSTTLRQPFAYAAYGHRHPVRPPLWLPGFNHEPPDPLTGHYLLGNGYRAFNPVLMRFNSADGESPFGEGMLNAYAYCDGDPVNQTDASGHVGVRVTISRLGRYQDMSDELARTRHPTAWQPNPSHVSLIQGTPSALAESRAKAVRAKFKVYTAQDMFRLRSGKKLARYQLQMKNALTLTRMERQLMNIQNTPLPLTPDGRWHRQRAGFPLDRGIRNIYDVPHSLHTARFPGRSWPGPAIPENHLMIRHP